MLSIVVYFIGDTDAQLYTYTYFVKLKHESTAVLTSCFSSVLYCKHWLHSNRFMSFSYNEKIATRQKMALRRLLCPQLFFILPDRHYCFHFPDENGPYPVLRIGRVED